VKNLTFLFFLAVFGVRAQTANLTPKLAADLVASDSLAQCNVIVQWNQIPTAAHHQKVISRGGNLRRSYSNVRSGAYSIPFSALGDLANDPDVKFITPDRSVNAKLDYTAAAVNAPAAWSLKLTGAGIGVALIDSGLNANADFNTRQRIVYSQDFTTTTITTATASTSETVSTLSASLATGSVSTIASTATSLSQNLIAPDQFGHGEHVAGILAGNGTNSSCANCDRLLKGIAPGVNIVNLRALGQNGSGTDSGVIAAIDQAINLASVYNIRVINLSLGRPVFESYTADPLCQAVEQAWKAGIVVVVAAGNDGRDNSWGNAGYGTIDSPGNDPYVITVGAMKTEGTYTRTDDLIASYSSKGPTLIDAVVKPDLVAPGNLVVSLLASTSATLAQQNPGNITPKGYYQQGNSTKPGNTFFQLSGTSMATPVVSGAAALLLQANPAMTPDQVKARLMLDAYKTFPASSVATDPATGQTYVSYYDIFTVGAGYLDIAAALADTSLAQGTALSPIAVYDSSTGTIGIVSDPSAVWNLTGVWGNSSIFDLRTVWGANAINSTRTMWGANTVWGASSVGANRTIWGAGVNVNGPAAQSMSSGVAVQPSSTTAAQSTSLSVTNNGEN